MTLAKEHQLIRKLSSGHQNINRHPRALQKPKFKENLKSCFFLTEEQLRVLLRSLLNAQIRQIHRIREKKSDKNTNCIGGIVFEGSKGLAARGGARARAMRPQCTRHG